MLHLIKEDNPIWNLEKNRIFTSIDQGTFEYNLKELGLGIALEHEWWKLVENKKVLGFGWINYTNDDFEISFVVYDDYTGKGLGSFIINELEKLGESKGYRKILAIVKETNPNSEKIIEYLYRKGYSFYIDGIDQKNIKQPIQSAIRAIGMSDVHLLKFIN